MVEKVWDLVGMHYPLQNNRTKLLKRLSHEYAFMDPDLDKVQT